MTGYEGLSTAAAWIDLSNRGKIRVTGEDRARLLHAMSTNDIKNLPAGEGLYTFFLNDKGRILGDAYVYNFGESLLLDTEPETTDKLREHLDKYIIADDATLEDETEQWAEIGLEGPKSVECAAALDVSPPEKKYSVRQSSNGFAARTASTGTEGVRIFMPLDEKDTFIRRLETLNVPKASVEEARIVRLENGVPRYGEDISERYLVQETQATHAVHTNKGCYLGQEIVERVRSRGQVHRLLMPIRIKSATPFPSGTKISSDGKDIAEITSSAYSPRFGEVVALAYVRAEPARDKPQMMVSGTDVVAYIP